MASGLIDIMKRAAIDANEASQPTDLRFGTVVSVKPMKIQITNQMVIPESLLILPVHLTDYTVPVTFNWTTETAGSHQHSYSGTDSEGDSHSGNVDSAGSHVHQITSGASKTITIHNALKVGDKVVLIRKQGGQAFYILDKI